MMCPHVFLWSYLQGVVLPLNPPLVTVMLFNVFRLFCVFSRFCRLGRFPLFSIRFCDARTLKMSLNPLMCCFVDV